MSLWWPRLVGFGRNIEFCFYKQRRPQSTMILQAEAEDLPSLRCQTSNYISHYLSSIFRVSREHVRARFHTTCRLFFSCLSDHSLFLCMFYRHFFIWRDDPNMCIDGVVVLQLELEDRDEQVSDDGTRRPCVLPPATSPFE